MSVRQFNNVKLAKVRRNKFNLSHSRLMTCDPFYLYPCLVEDCIPGDKWTIGSEVVVRNNPLNAPIMHEQNCYIHYFFVPYRLLWKNFEKFMTGGKDGDFVGAVPSVLEIFESRVDQAFRVGGLMDYLGFNTVTISPQTQWQVRPDAFPVLAYLFVWNEYYRDGNLMDDVWETGWNRAKNLVGDDTFPRFRMQDDFIEKGFCDAPFLLKRCWTKDYFTSALPWQQRGQVPAFSVVDTINNPVEFTFPYSISPDLSSMPPIVRRTENIGTSSTGPTFARTDNNDSLNLRNVLNANNRIKDNAILLDADVHDLRLAFQITLFLERNARTGHRYVEFLKAHFPAYPRDDRLQRPEYIGGQKIPVLVSEVLQTAEDNNTSKGVGSMAGHGISVDRSYSAKYNVQEHGIILGLMSFVVTPMYEQGLERQWHKESRYDFYFPEFANLSEQAIRTWELYNYSTGYPVEDVFGYQGRYDEYRFRRNSVHGSFRDTFRYWHMGRKFGSAPVLNTSFVMPSSTEIEDPSNGLKRVLQVPSEPQYLVHLGNILKVVRPLPFVAQPGLVDHSYS